MKNLAQFCFYFYLLEKKNIFLNQPLILAQRGLFLIVNIMANNPHMMLK